MADGIGGTARIFTACRDVLGVASPTWTETNTTSRHRKSSREAGRGKVETRSSPKY